MFLVAILAAVVALVITGHTAWAIAVGIVGGVITLISLAVAGAAISAVKSTRRRLR